MEVVKDRVFCAETPSPHPHFFLYIISVSITKSLFFVIISPHLKYFICIYALVPTVPDFFGTVPEFTSCSQSGSLTRVHLFFQEAIIDYPIKFVLAFLASIFLHNMTTLGRRIGRLVTPVR